MNNRNRKNGTWWTLALLIGLVSISGCVANPTKERPTKPHLNVEVREDGGICLDREDSSKLGEYILELENR